MSRAWFILALLLSVGLSTAIAQEPREKPRPGRGERPTDRTLPPPPVVPYYHGTPAVRSLPGAMPMPGMPSLGRIGQPQPPIDPRAPLVSVQLVMAEVVADAAGKAGPEPQPAPSGPAKGPTTLPLDLSAPSEKILEELRKQGMRGRLDVLYQVQLTTADQNMASFHLGQTQPQITGVTLTQFGQTNSVTQINTGLRVEVHPRVDGSTVWVMVDVQDSRLGRSDEGTPISVSAKGDTIRAAPVYQRTLQTTVKGQSGQTIVLSGVIQEDGPRKRQLMVLLCPRIVPPTPSEGARPAR